MGGEGGQGEEVPGHCKRTTIANPECVLKTHLFSLFRKFGVSRSPDIKKSLLFLSCRENESPSRSNLEKEIPMLEIGVPIRNTVLTNPPAPENPVTAQTPESTESQSTPTQQPPLPTRYANSIISFHLRLPDCTYVSSCPLSEYSGNWIKTISLEKNFKISSAMKSIHT